MKEKIYLGSCKSVHGLKGAFKLYLENQNDSILNNGMEIWISKNSQFEKRKIEEIKFGNKCLLFLDGVTTRTQSESLVPFEVFINREDLPSLDGDEFYLNDIIGFDAWGENEKEPRGKIRKFYSNGAQDIAVVHGKRSIDIPLVKPFLIEINFDKKIVYFNFPRGL